MDFGPYTRPIRRSGARRSTSSRASTSSSRADETSNVSMGQSEPLLAVIGDSFVEGMMVPFSETCHGRLARGLAPAARVYAFGVNASSLSQ